MDRGGDSTQGYKTAEEVANEVGKLLGNDKYSEFIVNQGLDGVAFSELEEEHLKLFRTATDEAPNLGELLKLKAAARKVRNQLQPNQETPAAPEGSGVQAGGLSANGTQDSTRKQEAQEGRKGSGRSSFERSSQGPTASSSLFGKRTRGSETKQAAADDDDYTDSDIFRKAKKSRYLIDSCGARFVLNLQHCYAILKKNVDEAAGKMKKERLQNLDCQKNPKDCELLDGIEKKTLLEFQEKFNGRLVTRGGREVAWPTSALRHVACTMFETHKDRVIPERQAKKKECSKRAASKRKQNMLDAAGSTSSSPPRQAPKEGQRILLFGFKHEEDTDFPIPVKLGSGVVAAPGQATEAGNFAVKIDGIEDDLDTTGVFLKENMPLNTVDDDFKEAKGNEGEETARREASNSEEGPSDNQKEASALPTSNTSKREPNGQNASAPIQVGAQTAEPLASTPAEEQAPAALSQRLEPSDPLPSPPPPPPPPPSDENLAKKRPKRNIVMPKKYTEHAGDCQNPNICDGACIRSKKEPLPESPQRSYEGSESSQESDGKGDGMDDDESESDCEIEEELKTEITAVEKGNFGLVARLCLGLSSAN
ncbi:hypothetical protein KFL_001170115 [Klebsormidium nitens]|uniref:SAM domain-containing protein n=1 Tax=Klebsormidium nitens TaxID=105231 RepID=A0A1Y1I1G1_KLENI|nr:hypothetical protein KFL_001170115 [Klebsormidium nitens]|eukprot:GAQ82607.1 hypothetical protein KFL_001170115 [Klebsormidium nitens]